MPLSNFGRVSLDLFRSAQPDAHAWETLRFLGINAALKLNSDAEYPRAREAEEAGALVEVWEVPVDQWHPNAKDVIEIVRQAEAERVKGRRWLWHCTHGRDRTGLLIGAWRLLCDGWPIERANEERRSYGVTGIIALADHEISECLVEIARKVSA